MYLYGVPNQTLGIPRSNLTVLYVTKPNRFSMLCSDANERKSITMRYVGHKWLWCRQM
jgi:hypothetical protein